VHGDREPSTGAAAVATAWPGTMPHSGTAAVIPTHMPKAYAATRPLPL